MRFLGASVFALGLLSLSSSVSARCLGDTDIDQEYKPLKGGTPSPLAVPLYWTNAPVNGNLGGLAGADLTCQSAALFSGIPLLADKYDLFKAILSTRTIDARDRFAAVTPPDTDPIDTQFDVVTANNECLMDSVYYLFQGSLNLNSDLAAEDGTFASDTIEVFTGTKGDGTKWYVPGVDSSNDKIINSAYCSTSLSPDDEGWTSSNTNPSGTDNTVIDPMIGRMFNALSNNDRMWLGGQNKGCGNGLHLLCLQAAPSPTQPPTTPPPTNPPTNPPTPGGQGDPQFTGLQGQSFQVHGMPDEFFNLISLPDMQLNSRFAYLASGRCNYNNTECWTHPGTYVDQLGFMFPGLFIKAVAGTHDEGMSVFVNDKRISAATGADSVTQHTIRGHTHGLNDTQIVTVSYTRHDQLIIAAPLFTVTATNSDMFFNFGVSLHSPSLLSAGSAVHHVKSSSVSAYPSFPLHGLLGQTWKNARYSNGRFFQGTVDDYMLLDAQLFSTKFVFNQYKH